ncbi:MAG: Regulator of sigma-W protease RasP [Eubacteriales bacterium SKADARSKE-1]|nr:Regulator of sigma-W protease RasP [Eubacteriales bacterium SKADARSKE-1]
MLFHEFGHFITAKLSGVQVNEFAIGMGPTLFKIQKGETKYSLRLFPIGGFCSMEGEDEKSTNEKAFSNKPVGKRIIIIVAGAIMNIILAFILMMIVLSQQSQFASTQISKFMDNSVTNHYGLKIGDTIKKINGYSILTYTDIAFILATDKDFTADVVVERNSEIKKIEGVHFATTQDSNGKEVLVRDFYVAPIEKNFFTFFQQTFNEVVSNVRLTYMSFWKIITGEFGLNAVSGPVGIASAVTDAATSGLEVNFLQAVNNIITIMMVLSVSLGVMNLLPFPALDGGRLIFLFIEAIIKRPVSPKYEGLIHTIGFVILMALALFVTFNDVFKLIMGKSLGG